MYILARIIFTSHDFDNFTASHYSAERRTALQTLKQEKCSSATSLSRMRRIYKYLKIYRTLCQTEYRAVGWWHTAAIRDTSFENKLSDWSIKVIFQRIWTHRRVLVLFLSHLYCNLWMRFEQRRFSWSWRYRNCIFLKGFHPWAQFFWVFTLNCKKLSWWWRSSNLVIRSP